MCENDVFAPACIYLSPCYTTANAPEGAAVPSHTQHYPAALPTTPTVSQSHKEQKNDGAYVHVQLDHVGVMLGCEGDIIIWSARFQIW